MQQASNSNGNPSPNNGSFLPSNAASASGSPRFVINLCASTTPVGLVQPNHAGLKRFTFFVSRRLEEGRERFRLHMGYFESQEEAEKILDLVRDVYPAAWAGVAPGIKLRSRTAVSAPTPAAPAPAPVPVAAAPMVAPALPTPTSTPTSVPVLGPALATPVAAAAAAPAATMAAPEALQPAAPVSAAVVPTLAASIPHASMPHVPTPHVPTPVVAPTAAAGPPVKLELVADLPRTVEAAPAIDAAPAVDAETGAAARSLDNIRATIESLADEVPAAKAAAAAEALDAPSVLRLLESARPGPAAPPAPVARPAPTVSPNPVFEPMPTSAGATLRKAVLAPRVSQSTPPLNETAVYAVQLLWSVQAIDMNQIPQLAIFSAYTLYGAEGNRDGRRWYGLRLGFFTDAVSAKQVAQYVRSEFNSVSVVPVTHRERERAGAATAKPLPAVSTTKPTGIELNFIEDVPTDTATSGSRPALQLTDTPPAAKATGTGPAEDAKPAPDVKARAAAAVGMSTRATPGKRAKLRVGQGTRPVAKRPVHGRPLSLEETLEVLGASQLQIDNGRGELLNDASQRERKPAASSGSRFGRLINRLAERLGNG